jgi:hypothetical protein
MARLVRATQVKRIEMVGRVALSLPGHGEVEKEGS